MKTEHVLCPISFRRKLRQQHATRASWPSRDTRSQIYLNSTMCHEGCRREFTGMFILLLQFLFLFLTLSLLSSGSPISSRIQLRQRPKVNIGNCLQRLHHLKSGVCRTLPLPFLEWNVKKGASSSDPMARSIVLYSIWITRV